MSLPAIEFRGVSVRFRVPQRKIPTFKEWAIQRLTRGLRYEELHALDRVSFTVAEGESLGVIGPNGAGKSTLLRVAAGILSPSAGEAIVRGRVAPLIELGTGFDMELTGRENVFFNGALLGRSRREMQVRFDEIVDFSGLAEFIDAPLRTYSTGMVARLAFAVATCVDADILLLDEILAVGDERFRRRCRRRIDAFRQQGATMVLVSHELEMVERFCAQAVLLESGRVTAAGSAGEVAARYRSTIRSQARRDEPQQALVAAGDPQRPPGWRRSRAGVAFALIKAQHGSDFEPAPATGLFPDVPARHPDAPYVEHLVRGGIASGFADGLFRPEDPITRAQLAVLVVRVRTGGRGTPPEAQGVFADVPPSYWAAAYIEQLYREGVLGDERGSEFHPDRAVADEEVGPILERAFD
ncbi:MAG: ATP-binding cassette domain-containing protein [Acidobacteriota bacterium]